MKISTSADGLGESLCYCLVICDVCGLGVILVYDIGVI